MDRSKKLFLNTTVSLLHQIIALICGFILPRYFLVCYGSEVNGLISSITQFLGFITLAECGVGAVVQSALYKPLADKNEDEISKIIISAERFFKRIAAILVAYTAVLMVIYPFITIDSFDYFFTMSLIFVISISSFAQYYFSMSYRLLLNADQMAFVQLGTHSIALILNTVLSVLMMKYGAEVRMVKLMSSLLFLIQPLVLVWYVKKHYNINKKLVLHEEPIKQKWNGLAQHIAAVVLGNTDTVVLTLFSSLANVSIYAVYNLVVTGIKQIVTSMTTGMQSMLGNMYARNENKTLNETFSNFEWLLHTVTVIAFSCACFLIVPFVRVYTNGIKDTNYIVPAFAIIISLANGMYCLRLPYNMMVMAAGHYKETQASAIFEALINIVVSVVLVIKSGLIGVAIGTLVAMVYRTVYLAYYLSKNILMRKMNKFVKHMIVDVICVFISTIATRWYTLDDVSYINWFLMAIKVGITVLLVVGIINTIFYRDEMKKGILFLIKR